MSDSDELSITELRRRRQQTGGGAPGAQDPAPAAQREAVRAVEFGLEAGVAREALQPPAPSHSRWLQALHHNWRWPVVAAVVLGALGFVFGYLLSDSVASVTLVQREALPSGVSVADGSFKPPSLSVAALIDLMRSPELARRVAAKSNISESKPLASVTIVPVAGGELAKVEMKGREPGALVHLLNLYAQEAVSLTREIQQEESARLMQFLSDKLAQQAKDLEGVRAELAVLQTTGSVHDPEAETQTLLRQLGEVESRRINTRIESELLEVRIASPQHGAGQNPLLGRLDKARERRDSMSGRYTRDHPEVQMVQAEITDLESQLAVEATNTFARGANSPQSLELKTRKTLLADELKKLDGLRDELQGKMAGLSQTGLQYHVIKVKLDSLMQSYELLTMRQREAHLSAENAPGYYRVFTPATIADISNFPRWLHAAWALAASVALGLGGGVMGVLLVEAKGDRLCTAADVQRVTGLPVLATLGDHGRMSDLEKDQWAFRTWTIINGKLNRQSDRGLVCGFISALPGEGRTTWIDLLASAASRRGLRVLKITARPADPQPTSGASGSPETAPAREETKQTGGIEEPDTLKNALTRPDEVIQQLTRRNVAQAIDLPLEDWVWHLDRRRQWQAALAHWRSVENVVILVELPPASHPEAILLAENVPQLIWLARSGCSPANETRQQLETLRHARCQMVGAVLNHASDGII